MNSTSFLSKHKIASLLIVVFIFFPVCSAFGEEKAQKTVNEKILEILIDKNVITKEQYEELKIQAQAEESAKTPKVAAGSYPLNASVPASPTPDGEPGRSGSDGSSSRPITNSLIRDTWTLPNIR
ncbi:MAG: putative porin, partial [Proteobacteria bacterium]|nr:putative porin [Pseudomonadota bacterium]